jgi:hypothetical protein
MNQRFVMRHSRKIFAVIAGAMAGMVLIAIGEWILSFIFPPPKNIDMNNPDAVKAVFAAMPFAAFLSLLFNYALASVVGGWVATKISGLGKAVFALIVGVLLMLAAAANIIMYPHPLWFAIINLAEFVPFAWIGYRIFLATGKFE